MIDADADKISIDSSVLEFEVIHRIETVNHFWVKDSVDLNNFNIKFIRIGPLVHRLFTI